MATLLRMPEISATSRDRHVHDEAAEAVRHRVRLHRRRHLVPSRTVVDRPHPEEATRQGDPLARLRAHRRGVAGVRIGRQGSR